MYTCTVYKNLSFKKNKKKGKATNLIVYAVAVLTNVYRNYLSVFS